MFHPDDEIILNKPINGRPTKYKTTFFKFNKSFEYEKELKFKKDSEYLMKKINFKKIPNYSVKLNKVSEQEMKEIIDFVNQLYKVNFSEYASGKNENNETVIYNVTLQPNNEIDIEKIKKEFPNSIIEIQTLKPNLLVYVFRIRT